MRPPVAVLAGSLLVSACISGTRVVYVPVPAGTTPVAAHEPPPAQVALPPVGVTIVQANEAQLLVSMDQPAYLAVFEIVPTRGVTLVYPTSPRQRQLALSGSRWLSLRWRSQRGYDDLRGEREIRSGQSSSVHYVYAVASDRPLLLTQSAFDDGSLGNMLGMGASRSADVYETMDAISRRFVPAGLDEDWGEDMYTMNLTRPVTTVRVATVYCADGSVVYVRDEMADRAWCPWRSRGVGGSTTPPPRPDSVVASSGRPVRGRFDPTVRTPVYRVPRPTGGIDAGGVAAGNGGATGGGNAAGDQGKGHQDNGNHYGWQNGNRGNGGTASGNGNSTEPGVQQQGQPNGTPQDAKPDVKAQPEPEAKPDEKSGNPKDMRRAIKRAPTKARTSTGTAPPVVPAAAAPDSSAHAPAQPPASEPKPVKPAIQ